MIRASTFHSFNIDAFSILLSYLITGKALLIGDNSLYSPHFRASGNGASADALATCGGQAISAD
jgi:hypothetical protein